MAGSRLNHTRGARTIRSMNPPPLQILCLVAALILLAATGAFAVPMERPTPALGVDFGRPADVEATPETHEPASSAYAAAVEQATVDRVNLLSHQNAVPGLPRSLGQAARTLRTSPPVWLGQLLASNSAETRLRAVELCDKKKDPAYLELLLGALDDPDATVRERTVAALGSYDTETLTERVLLAMSSPEKSTPLSGHLSTLRTQLAPGFRALLNDETATATRRQVAAYALGVIGDTDALDTLGALSEAGEYPMALVSAQAMLALRTPEALPYWLSLSTHEDEQLRAVAVDGLAEAGGDQALARLEEIASGDGQSGPWLQVSAVRYIGAQPARTAVPALVRIMEGNAATRPETGELLRKLTGWQFDNDPALWRAWLENPQQFMPDPEGERPTEDSLVVEDSPLETLGSF